MSGHRWWRVSNIKIRDGATSLHGSCAELRFNTMSGIESNIPSNGLSAHYPSDRPDLNAYAAFDNDPTTFTYSNWSDENNKQNTGYWNWWIGYKFDTPQLLKNISVQMVQWMGANTGQEWQTAQIDYSDDGVNWIKYGIIDPKITKQDISLKTIEIIRQGLIGGNSKQDDGKPSRFVLIHNWDTGEFIDKIVPDSQGNWQKQLLSNIKTVVTQVGDNGYRPIADAPIIPVVVD